MDNENKTMFAKAASTNENFGWSSIFKGVGQAHSRDDMDNQFAAGLRGHIPSGNQLLDGWQKPWLFSRFLAYGILVWIIVMLWLKYGAVDVASLSTIVLIPSAVVPISMLLFFWELNIPRNVPIYMVFKWFVLSGVFTSIIVQILNLFLDNSKMPKDKFGYWFVIGLVEELTKFILIAVALRKKEFCWGLNGLALGAAVGAGFAVFESVGYLLSWIFELGGIEAFTNNAALQALADGILLRGISAIVLHTAWGTMYGAALALAKGKQKLGAKHFADTTVLITFFSAILLHAAWNYQEIFVKARWDVAPQLFDFLYNRGILSIILRTAVFAIPTYALILWVVRKSIRQAVAYAGNASAHQDQVVGYGTDSYNAYPPANNDYAPQANAGGSTLLLRCVSGELAGQTYTIARGRSFMLGRGAANNIQYADNSKGVSRSHCSIAFDGNAAMITDLGSTHGTFLADGRKMQPNLGYSLSNGESFYVASPKNTFSVTIQ